jgi:hypothetical protein
MEVLMRRLLVFSAALALVVGSTSHAAVIPVGLQGGDVTVTVTYTGKGKVDDTHDILVFLFDHPDPTANSKPIAREVINKSGGTATFKAVQGDAIYITAVYDEKGDYDGLSGPPPPGTPVATYGKAGKAIAVKPAKGTKIKMSFDDSRRFGK